MTTLPTLFISHGAPNLLLHDTPARRFLGEYSAHLPRPEAILLVSAHFETPVPTLTAGERPETIHDFYGFEDELYEMVYPAPGSPFLAMRVAGLIEQAGLPAAMAPERGLDHGAWVPLTLLYPDADIPVVQLSVQTQLGAAHHLRLGRSLESLRRDGVLIVGSGSMTHNLAEFFRGNHSDDAPAPDWVSSFSDWARARIEAGDAGDLVAYRERAPHAVRNHPTEEHFLPLFVALGAAGEGAGGRRVHDSGVRGVLQMDAFLFE